MEKIHERFSMYHTVKDDAIKMEIEGEQQASSLSQLKDLLIQQRANFYR
jgi:hypothetical protein